MTEPTIDPLSGLPSPMVGSKSSPLKDMNEDKDARSQRWWLADSVHPDQHAPSEVAKSEEEPTTAPNDETAAETDLPDVAKEAKPSATHETASQDDHITNSPRQRNGGSPMGLLLAGVAICAILFLVFKD